MKNAMSHHYIQSKLIFPTEEYTTVKRVLQLYLMSVVSEQTDSSAHRTTFDIEWFGTAEELSEVAKAMVEAGVKGLQGHACDHDNPDQYCGQMQIAGDKAVYVSAKEVALASLSKEELEAELKKRKASN